MSEKYSYLIHPDFGNYTIKDDILITPMWTEDFCNQMIELVESRPEIMEKSYDDAQMFMLNELDLHLLHRFASHYKNQVVNLLKKEWMLRFSHPRVDIPGLFSPFFLRYKMDQCRELGLHTDSGIVSMSIKCNLEYKTPEGILKTKYTEGNCYIWKSDMPHRPTYVELGEGELRICFILFFVLKPNKIFYYI